MLMPEGLGQDTHSSRPVGVLFSISSHAARRSQHHGHIVGSMGWWLVACHLPRAALLAVAVRHRMPCSSSESGDACGHLQPCSLLDVATGATVYG